ncbi:uncharacterized protein ColSpa_08952 [Colletotrichum spaethianum]|uniref:Uncharacterized protein n=1 Tax=Colletotrichum spaethianum TaxID=700344 RepID=A0AA37PAN5_9PEZI|nr:uncharacterized protein ColSpa_08952 [Colletotrichum spaethianum]GKT48771.1 hypothetical protein ColSpa_08952 [Colletotrichum spaethianum]
MYCRLEYYLIDRECLALFTSTLDFDPDEHGSPDAAQGQPDRASMFRLSRKPVAFLCTEIFIIEELEAHSELLYYTDTSLEAVDEPRRLKVVYHIVQLFNRIRQDNR